MEKIAKQVIVIRKDLNMRKGKMVAQGAHASMKFILDRGYYGQSELDSPEEFHSRITSPAIKSWMEGLFTKVCVSVDSEEELVSIYEKAKESGTSVKKELISALSGPAGLGLALSAITFIFLKFGVCGSILKH